MSRWMLLLSRCVLLLLARSLIGRMIEGGRVMVLVRLKVRLMVDWNGMVGLGSWSRRSEEQERLNIVQSPTLSKHLGLYHRSGEAYRRPLLQQPTLHSVKLS